MQLSLAETFYINWRKEVYKQVLSSYAFTIKKFNSSPYACEISKLDRKIEDTVHFLNYVNFKNDSR